MTATHKLSVLAKKVRIEVKFGAELEWSKQDKWQQQANGYRCTLKYQGRRYSFDFWCGSGITRKPDAESCLECLLSDANSGELDFEQFCGDLGYDSDSRKAEQTWKAYQKTAARLKRLLGDDYDTFMYSER